MILLTSYLVKLTGEDVGIVPGLGHLVYWIKSIELTRETFDD